MYARCYKRILDFVLSFLALIVLSPILLVLTIVGAVIMKGNPFFVQQRPGRIDKKTGKEKIFKLVKFRSMSNAKDKHGNLLSDEVRLGKYGKILRATSLDELPELWNILKGDMSIVGPRPLVVKYLPYYTSYERERHFVRPGLTGWAQVNGRNDLKWEDKFKYDVEYAHSVSFLFDTDIIFKTIKTILKREGIGIRGTETLVDFDIYREQQTEGVDVH